MLKIVYHTQFKKDYKKIIKRGYQEKLFVEVLHYLNLILTLSRTGTHSDLF